MEFKGTKGGWKALPNGRIVDRNDNTICSTSYGEYSLSIENAKLIASAPDLLKASIKMSKAISEGNNLLLSEANLELKTAIHKALK